VHFQQRGGARAQFEFRQRFKRLHKPEICASRCPCHCELSTVWWPNSHDSCHCGPSWL
jgi:hypothetical protein